MKTGTGRAALALALCAGLAAPPSLRGGDTPNPGSDREKVVHALNRLSFGPRPGDVERVSELGLAKWIEQQLQPERIAEPSLAQRLEPLATQRMATAELVRKYELPPAGRRELQQAQAERMDAGGDEQLQRRQLRLELEKKYNLEGNQRQVLVEQQQAKLLRAVASERQLEEVMVDFWFNHFNVFADKGPEKLLLPEYEREVIRKHALGRFEELLLATAKSPAMLFYLDNWLSADPDAAKRVAERRALRQRRRGAGAAMEAPPNPGGPRRAGLNENYARELLELHTLGVDGGYTQKDVTEIARCFTGWTIEGLRDAPRFEFASMLHDPGDKQVLGRTVKGAGMNEGLEILHRLATHPNTARFVSYKLARRFVADEPPQALVERAAATFQKSDGDIRKVLKSIFDAPEFWGARQAKVKTPFEFVVSALRASGAELQDARDVARRLGEMGMPLYLQQPPTGYKDTADAWVSTSGLLARLNFALDLAGGRVRGVKSDVRSLAPHAGDGSELARALAAQLVPAGLGEQTRKTLDEKAGQSLDAPRVAGLVLGSPEFQRR
jgi:uncharacterized protein (DUF1800 family)